MVSVARFQKLLNKSLSIRKSKLLVSCSFSIREHQHKVSFMNIYLKNNDVRLFSTLPLSNTDVTVYYKDGLPVVALPLPSRRETCEFTLKPLSQNVGDFMKFIKAEDGGIDTINFFTKDGSRIAKSTSIDVLLRSDFQIDINQQKYQVKPPLLSPVSSEDTQTVTDVKLLVSQLYSTINVEHYQLERQRELQTKLEDLRTQITPLEEKMLQLSAKADVNTKRLSWLGMGLMGLQFGILARLTWWEYSWDIMEPVTYFVTYGTTMAMFSYFLLAKQEYTFPNARDRQFLIKFHKLAQKDKLNLEQYNQLREAITKTQHDLRRLRDPLQLHLPIKELGKEVKKE